MSSFSLESEFYCCKCGTKGIPIVRKKGKEREAGHLKKIFCLNCQQEVNHVETKEWSKYDKDDFLLEFNYGNFTEDGLRKMKYSDFIQKLERGRICES